MRSSGLNEAQGNLDNLNSITEYIRWFFSALVLSYISILISGIILSEIPILRIRNHDKNIVAKFITGMINIKAYKGEFCIGFAGFILVLSLLGVFVGDIIPKIAITKFGLKNLTHFESLCVMSSFILISVSLFFKISYSAIVRSTPSDYTSSIEKLSKGKLEIQSAE